MESSTQSSAKRSLQSSKIWSILDRRRSKGTQLKRIMSSGNSCALSVLERITSEIYFHEHGFITIDFFIAAKAWLQDSNLTSYSRILNSKSFLWYWQFTLSFVDVNRTRLRFGMVSCIFPELSDKALATKILMNTFKAADKCLTIIDNEVCN